MEESPGNIVASEKQCSQAIVALKRLRREGGEVVARQVDLLEDLQVGEGAFVDRLDVRLLEADLLKVVQAERTEYVFGKLLQIVAIHDEDLKEGKMFIHTIFKFQNHFIQNQNSRMEPIETFQRFVDAISL